jgi:hypothetical protein
MLNRIVHVVGLVLVVSGCRVVEPTPPPEAPRISSFVADKTRVASGEQVTLSFATAGATKLELRDDQGRQVELQGSVEEGTALVAPLRSSFYVLTATGVGGRDAAFVQIAVNEPLRDLFLIAVPAVINAGEQAMLLWGAQGASTVTLTTGAGTPVALTGTTGSVVVSPASSERYALTAQGAPGTPALTALSAVQVRPVLSAAGMQAATGVGPAKTLAFSWKTAGATRVTITESNFGQLTSVTDGASVANGTFDYVLPDELPNGIAVLDGLPLRFTVSAIAGDVTVTKVISAVVGEKPVFELLTVPDFVTANATFNIRWKTLGATQITILVDDLPVFQTIASEQARVVEGSVSLPSPLTQSDYVVVASNARAEVRERRTVRTVQLPVINTFTLPGSINAPGDPATARWTTTNASRVQLRLAGGSTLAVVSAAGQVASGFTDIRLLTTSNVVLEAYNQAGDVVTLSRRVTVNGAPAVFVDPTPVIRGNQATLNWALAPFGALEVVGLPLPAVPTAVAASPNFIDLSTVPTAASLVVSDVADGRERLLLPSGFTFPLLGELRSDLWVSVNGFIALSSPSTALSSNAALTASSTPAMLAPFWDDLTMVATSRILTSVQTSPTTGERYFVVQWDKFKRAGDMSSDLTFQVQLFETGQVSFVYKTVTAAVLNSATVGIKDVATATTQQFVFDGAPMTAIVANDLELAFFTGAPVAGTRTFTATVSKRIEFFARTATAVLPVSAEVRTFGAGDVSVTEVMPLPEASVATTGQWIELRNNATIDLDFDGLVVSSTGSTPDGGYIIPSGTIVPAGGYLVLGQSTNATANGGAGVTLAVTDVPLAVPDVVRVGIQGTALGSIAYDAGVVGTSVQTSGSVLTSGNVPVTCTRMRTFGPNGAFGTPGAANEACSPYSVEQIPGGFVDISATGAEILVGTDDYTAIGTYPLGMTFNYFGQPYTDFNISIVGFITFGPALTAAYDSTNAVTPSATDPNGVVAAFWDQMVRNTGGKVLILRDPARTIISWQNFRIYADFGSVMAFQLHLLPSGVIEVHYGSLTTTATSQANIDRHSGSSATVWLERPDGLLAVPWSVDRLGGIQQNTGVRFTPSP